LDLPSIDPITLSLDEIFITQNINFDTMFSDLSSDNDISDTLLKETKTNNNKDFNLTSKFDYSDNTLYSDTESSNERINDSLEKIKIKKETTPKEVKTNIEKDDLIKSKELSSTIKKVDTPKVESSKEQIKEQIKVEPSKEQIKVEPKIEKLNNEINKKPILETKVNSSKIKNQEEEKLKEEKQPEDKKLEKTKSIEKEPIKVDVKLNDIQKDSPINEVKINKDQINKDKINDDKIDDDKIDDDKTSEDKINEDQTNNDQINNEPIIQNKLTENENIEKPQNQNDNNENEEDKHSNMVLKEKLYEEQKNQNKIGLLKNAEMLNITSSFKKSKTKQKAVQFKSSWSGELENTRRMSKDHGNYISTSKGNFLIKLNKMDIRSTCPVFFSGNFETDSIYTMFCEFKCDDEVYFTSKQYPIHSNNPQISLNEDVNIPITADQNILEINVMLIKKTPSLMPPPSSSKSGKHSNSSGMSTLTRTMTHSKKAVQNLMFWKKNKNMDGFNSVNTGHMHNNMMNFDENSLKKNDLQFRSLSSTSSISKLFTNDGGSSIQSSHRGRNYHPSVKTIFNNNGTGIPSPSNGLSRESTCECISESNSSLNSSYSAYSTYSTYSTNTSASTNTITSSSSNDNVFVAGKITIDLKNLREQHMGELIEDFRWDITPPKPLKNNSIDSGNKYNIYIYIYILYLILYVLI